MTNGSAVSGAGGSGNEAVVEWARCASEEIWFGPDTGSYCRRDVSPVPAPLGLAGRYGHGPLRLGGSSKCRSLDQNGRDRRERGLSGDAEFIVQELTNR